jgi:hypothetical protein
MRSAVRKLALAAEIAAAYARARWSLSRAGLPATLARLRSPGRTDAARCPAGDPGMAGRRLAHAVVRMLSAVPADSRCLVRSLVLTRLLARRGIESRLVIAVCPGEPFAAHAWVEQDGVALLPVGPARFEELVTL